VALLVIGIVWLLRGPITELRAAVDTLRQQVGTGQQMTDIRTDLTARAAEIQNIQTTATQCSNDIKKCAKSDDLERSVRQLQQEISLLKRANEIALAWNRTMPPPPFAPQVTSVTPAEDHVSGGAAVVIKGRNLSSDGRVWFGVKEAQVDAKTSNANELHVTAPASLEGEVDVCVQSLNGLMSAAVSFKYVP
jgi:hypothetical protein